MVTNNANGKTEGRTSPKGGTRGCLCANNTYSVKCCDGSLKAQGIGNIYGVIPTPPPIETYFILLENGNYLLTENNNIILKET